MKNIILIISLVLFYRVNAQYLEKINSIDKVHQNCLDKGVDMMNCSKVYYLRMDSMLNVVYKILRRDLSPNDFLKLKNEQLIWIKKRDKYMKDQNDNFQKKLNSNEWGNDMYMVVYSDNAIFVRKRIVELIKKIP